MPYRGALETVLGRCTALRERIERLGGELVAVDAEPGASAIAFSRPWTLEQARTLETRLRAQLDGLEEQAAEERALSPVARRTTPEDVKPDKAPMSPLLSLVVGLLLVATVVVFVVQFWPGSWR